MTYDFHPDARQQPGREEKSGPLVDLPAVADIVEEQPPARHIELVEHAVIPDAQSIFGTSGQAMVGISAEPGAHLIHLALYGVLYSGGQLVEGLAVGMRPDLKCRAHRRSRLARTILTGRNLGAGLVELSFDLVRKLELVFEELIEPLLEVCQLLRGEPRDSGLDFLHCAHADILPPLRDM